MQMKSWEYLVWGGVLLLCLLIGSLIGQGIAPEPVIGVVRFEAVIDFSTAEQMIDILEAARQDERVAGVVLELTSPGGIATSSESIFYTMLKLREEKPLVVVIDGLAVSGGYYMAAAANRIYAPASSYIGNVGTRGPRPVDPVLTPEELSSGPYKLSGGSRFDRVNQLNLVKEAFVNNVVHQRSHAEVNPLNIDTETVAEARIYLGSEALAIGMVDLEGGRSDAIAGAAELAGVESYTVVRLVDYLRYDAGPVQLSYENAVKEMVETAPPEAVFLVDSRIPLHAVNENSVIERHLLRLREIAPGSLESVEAVGESATGEPKSDQPDPTQGESS